MSLAQYKQLQILLQRVVLFNGFVEPLEYKNDWLWWSTSMMCLPPIRCAMAWRSPIKVYDFNVKSPHGIGLIMAVSNLQASPNVLACR
jgi:hypothetical protein